MSVTLGAAELQGLGGDRLLARWAERIGRSLVVVGTDRRVRWCNRCFVDLIGGGDPVGRTLTQAAPELGRTLGPVINRVRTLAASENLALRFDGPQPARHLSVDAQPLFDDGGRVEAVGFSLVDITKYRFEDSLSAGRVGSWEVDLDTGEIVWSQVMATILGFADDRSQSAYQLLSLVHEDDRETAWQGMLRSARAGGEHESRLRVVRPDGEIRWLELRAQTLTGADGRPARMIGVALDITERQINEELAGRLIEREHRSRVEAQAAEARLGFLVDAGTVLSSTLDPRATYHNLANLVVPRLADWCFVDITDDRGRLVEAALAHVPEVLAGDVRDLRNRRTAAGVNGLWSVRRVIASGQTKLIDDITDADFVSAAIDAEHVALYRRLAPRSAVQVPLTARSRTLGSLTLVTRVDRRLGANDQTLIESLAMQAGMALDNAILFESRSRVAQSLQASLLPPNLPAIKGVDLAARYRVAGDDGEIGGDLYDIFEMGKGVWAVVIGDVCGKGPTAAAASGTFRHTLRAAAIGGHRPSRVLGTTNDAIVDQLDDEAFCTAALVRLEASRSGRPGARLMISCGGHPAPLVRRAGGRVERVRAGGPLIGAWPQPIYTDEEVELDPGDAIVLYTNGVTEARRGTTLFGLARLQKVLESADGDTAEGLVDAVEDAVSDFRRGPAHDDLAVVVVRAAPGPTPR